MNSASFNSTDPSHNENGHVLSPKYDSQKDSAEKTEPVRKSFMQKVKEALRDWSAKDAQDQEYDDSRV